MSSQGRMRRVQLASGLALALLVPASWPDAAHAASPRGRLSDVTVSSEAETVTVTVKTSGPARYQADLIDGPARLVVDLEDTAYGWRRTPLDVAGTPPLRQIRGSQYRAGVARVVVELTRKVGYVIREEPDGLAITIPTAARGAAATPAAAGPKPVAVAAAAPAGRPEPPTPTPVPVARTEPSALARVPVQVAQATTPATPPPPPPAAGGQRLISLDFKEADVVNLLRILAAESGRNIVIGDDVKGKMSISLRNVPWELALDTIMEARNLQRTERDGVIRIVSTEQLGREREARARLEEAKLKAELDIRAKQAEAQIKEQEAQQRRLAAEAAAAEAQARGPLREETIRLAYADPEDVARTLQGILGIPAEGMPASTVPLAGPPPIPAPPFSQLFGPGAGPAPAPVVSPSADVLAKGITIRAHRPTNSIFIRHYAADLERIKRLIAEKLDVPLPQVKIEARMEILDRDDLFAIGVQWGGGGAARLPTRTQGESTLVGQGFSSRTGLGTGAVNATGPNANPNLTLTDLLPISGITGLPVGGNVVNLPIGSVLGGAASAAAGGLTFGIVGTRLNLNLALQALATQSKTRTLARPEVVTVENNKATISLGEEIPYATVSSAGTQIQFKEALLKLEVTPTVIREADGNKIKMKVVVENNSRGAEVNLGQSGQPPAINRRKAETEVLIKEGERLVIGGVTTNVDQEQDRKVPLFGDIPVLGWLFKQRGTQTTARELVVFITPSIVRQETALAAPPR
jgi:type IV pilus assembly protein PilQ